MHGESGLLMQVILYLVAMVVTVPIARRFGLGAVLGYLVAGAALGPYCLGWLAGSGAGAGQLAEFGVIMMLFLIGLELRPAVLWKLRGPIFGLGGSQVLASTIVGALIAMALGMPIRMALATGVILAMSSTAIALQSLQENGLAKRTGGEAAFSTLLFQDIAVIPVLALLPFLADVDLSAGVPSIGQAGASGSAWLQLLKILGAVVLLLAGGRYLLRPVFAAVAAARLRELFTAVALLLVLATTALMHEVGLSPALGAFLAGVALADNEYRHQLEIDIEPFKGLLLGVFFISVGSGIDFAEVARHPVLMLVAVLGIVAVKWVLLYALGRGIRMSRPDALLYAFGLAQGGEFAFVLLGVSRDSAIMSPGTTQLLTAAVALSMATAPLMIAFYARVLEPRLAVSKLKPAADEAEIRSEKEADVIVAGIGRFGQTVTRLLRATGHHVTVLDFDPDQVALMRKFGAKAFFGDASNLDLLHSAGADRARVLAIAIDDYEATLRMAEEVRARFPRLKILARAYDRVHAYKLIHRGVTDVYIETAGSALNMGIDAVRALGVPARQAVRTAALFKRNNDRSIQDLARAYHEADEASFVNQSKGWLQQFEKMLKEDVSAGAGDTSVAAARAWQAPKGPGPAHPPGA